MRGGAVAVGVFAAALAACTDLPLIAAPEVLYPREQALAFPSAFIGASSTAVLHLQNDSPTSHVAVLSFSGADAGAPLFWAPVATVTVGAGALASITLTFVPQTIGAVAGTLTVTAAGHAPYVVTLTGVGLADEPCSTPPECESLTFDPTQGMCVATTLADRMPCVDACLTDSMCLGGVCTGQPIDCDDGNPCTEDVCEPGAGCLHLTTLSVCPTSTDPCQVPTCSPSTGCSTAPAVDGTFCGTVDCVTAHVCLDGACQAEPVSEGAQCGVETPCQASGTCHSGQCVQGAPGVTNEAWEYDLDPSATLHWLALSDADDDLYWAQVQPDPEGGTDFDLVSVGRDGFPRFTTRLGNYAPGAHPHDVDLKMVGLLHGDLVVVFGQPNQLAAYHQSDGSLAWQIDFSDLVNRSYHPELFTGEDDLHVAQLVDDGDELVVSIIGVSHSDATDYSWGTWIRGLSWTDGSTQWEWTQDGRSRRLVGDGLGNLYEALWQLDSSPSAYFFANGVTNFAAIADGQVYALAPTGAPLWQHEQTELLDIAADGNRLFTDQMALDAGCTIDQSLEYAAAGTLADDLQTEVPWALFVYDWPMLSNGITYRLAVAPGNGCTGGATDAWLRAFDDGADQPDWTFGADLKATNVSATNLCNDGSVLFAYTLPDAGDGAILSAVIPDGGDAFECPVVGFSVLTEPVLQPGRWVVGGEANGAGVVISYQMPPTTEPATQGWTASRGNMARTNRPQ